MGIFLFTQTNLYLKKNACYCLENKYSCIRSRKTWTSNKFLKRCRRRKYYFFENNLWENEGNILTKIRKKNTKANISVFFRSQVNTKFWRTQIVTFTLKLKSFRQSYFPKKSKMEPWIWKTNNGYQEKSSVRGGGLNGEILYLKKR